MTVGRRESLKEIFSQMPTWTEAQYRDYLIRTTQTAADMVAGAGLQGPQLERDAGRKPLVPPQGAKKGTERFRVVVESYRSRLLDEDNGCIKPVLDCLRYCGAIPDDSPSHVSSQYKQRKVKKGEEKTVITVTRICPQEAD